MGKSPAMSFKISRVAVCFLLLLSACSSLIDTSDPALNLNRRTVRYVGVEVPIFVAADLPTIVVFPATVISELWQGEVLAKQVSGNSVTLLAWPDFPATGEKVAVRLVDGRPFRLWVVPAGLDQTADKNVTISEGRNAEDILREKRSFGFSDGSGW